MVMVPVSRIATEIVSVLDLSINELESEDWA